MSSDYSFSFLDNEPKLELKWSIIYRLKNLFCLQKVSESHFFFSRYYHIFKNFFLYKEINTLPTLWTSCPNHLFSNASFVFLQWPYSEIVKWLLKKTWKTLIANVYFRGKLAMRSLYNEIFPCLFLGKNTVFFFFFPYLSVHLCNYSGLMQLFWTWTAYCMIWKQWNVLILQLHYFSLFESSWK